MTSRICEYCDGALRTIGTARKNGKTTHGDWETRTMHKKCWIEQNKFDSMRYLIAGRNYEQPQPKRTIEFTFDDKGKMYEITK